MRISNILRAELVRMMKNSYDIPFGEVSLTFQFNNNDIVLIREKIEQTEKWRSNK